MLEADLEALLNRAVLRMRFERALRWAIGCAVAAFTLAAAVVFALRWLGQMELPLSLLVSIPPIAALLGGVLIFLLTRVPTARAAGRLDRCAATQEHLVTWHHLRTHNEAEPLSEAFKVAQRDATLRAAERVQLRRDAPVQFPRWSRAFWLALILFISAVLTPPADPAAQRRPTRSPGGSEVSVSQGSGISGDALINSVSAISRVQVLAPSQLRKFELIATDPRLPDELKAKALRELQNAIGGIPESELSPEVRRVLEELRQSAAAQKPDIKGSQTGVTNSTEIPLPAAPQPAAEYRAFEEVERGWSGRDARFSDVKEPLRRYYSSGGKQGTKP